MIKDVILRVGLPIIAFALLMVAIVIAFSQPNHEPTEPPFPAPQSPFKSTVAGVGIIEPQTGTTEVGTKSPGVIKTVYVKTNQKVKAGDPLFKLDDSEALAEVNLQQARLDTAKKELANVESQDNISKKQKDVAKAKVNEAQAALDLANTRLQNLTMNAPIDATVLKVNITAGENAQSSPLVVLGNLNKEMQVRVEIDESDILKISPKAKAVGILRGFAKKNIPLTFIKEEPIATPKQNLKGSGNELIDTRVFQIVYAFDNSNIQARPGQQMDVFIETVR